jgi:peptidylprolyl isomerase
MRRLALVAALALAACAPPAPPAPGPADFAPALQVDLEAMTAAAGGLRYRDLREGSGTAAAAGRRVEILYGVFLPDGTQVDANLDRTRPITFTVGDRGMIRGIDQAVRGMRPGGLRQVVVPPHLGYGSRGTARVPSGATLVFFLELASVR